MSTGKRDLKALNPYPVDFIFSIKHGVMPGIGGTAAGSETYLRKEN